jgi:hypothetical protein
MPRSSITTNGSPAAHARAATDSRRRFGAMPVVVMLAGLCLSWAMSRDGNQRFEHSLAS